MNRPRTLRNIHTEKRVFESQASLSLRSSVSADQVLRMNSILALCAISLVLLGCVQAHTGKCLPGSKHKATPSAEGDGFTACTAYKNNSCCTASFTTQLASPVTRVGNFSWTPCKKNLTKRCEAFMVKVECFYRCSPNVWFWRNPNFPDAFLNAPLCSGFCDSWFDACKDDLSCAKNWLTDFNYTTEPSSCQANTTCKKTSQVYTDGKDMCSHIWGKSFVYKKSEKAHDCLNLDFTGPNPNDEVVDTLFGNNTASGGTTVKPTTAQSSGDAVSSTLVVVAIVSLAQLLSTTE